MKKSQIVELVDELTAREVAALVRCVDGFPFFHGEEELKELRKLELVREKAWKPTDLGLEVFGYLVGRNDLVKRPASSSRPAPRRPNVKVASPSITARDTVCAECGGRIPGGTVVKWDTDRGCLHPHCADGAVAPKRGETPFVIEPGVVFAPSTAQRETSCTHCKGTIERQEPCVWVEGHGIYHPECCKKPSDFVTSGS